MTRAPLHFPCACPPELRRPDRAHPDVCARCGRVIAPDEGERAPQPHRHADVGGGAS